MKTVNKYVDELSGREFKTKKEDIVSENLGVFVESAKVYVVDADASYV